MRYAESMNEKTQQYNNLVLRAEIIHRDNQGKPTKEEGQLYREAYTVCQEIIDMNHGQSAVMEKWTLNQLFCKEKVDAIIAELYPQTRTASSASASHTSASASATNTQPVEEKPSSASSASSASVKTSPSGFTTKNASRDVTVDMIEKWHVKEPPRTVLDDIIGMEDEKNRLKSICDTLYLPKSDKTMGLEPSSSILLYGPPGTGKTTLVEGVANELMTKHGFHYIVLKGSDVHQSLVGVGEKIVQTAFQEAIDNAPCILFIDEFDNVCAGHGADNKVESHEKRLTVAFLQAYNDMLNSEKQILFIGATNHRDKIDNAMLSRYEKIFIPLPNEDLRRAFLTKKLANYKLEAPLTIENIVADSDGWDFRDMNRLLRSINLKIKKDNVPQYTVLKADGSKDDKKTDIAFNDAILSGKFTISVADYETAKAEAKDDNEDM